MRTPRKRLSLPAHAVDRLDDMCAVIREEQYQHISRTEMLTTLIYAATPEPAGLYRLVRLGRMEQLAEPDEHAYAQCERSAIALGWRGDSFQDTSPE